MSERKFRRVSFHDISLYLFLGLLAIFGFCLLLYSTPEGLGLNDDSIAYISGARGILSGEGYRELWLVSRGFLTHFPPGYSAMLALVGFVTHLDPLRVSRAMNALFFGGNAFLLGLLCWRGTRSSVAAVFLAALFIATPAFLRVHSNALSEPQYVFLTLITILLFDLYFEHYSMCHSERAPFANEESRLSQKGFFAHLHCTERSAAQVSLRMTLRKDGLGYLIASGFVASLAYLTRYAGLALIATILFSLLILHTDWRTRLTRSVTFIASALPLMLAWSIRNEIAGGSLTNRSAGWHPITADNVKTGLREFSEFIMPFERWRQTLNKIPYFYLDLVIPFALVLLLWVLLVGLRYFFKPGMAPKPASIPFVHGLYIFGYFSSLIVTMTIFDPATKFQLRIVAPIFVSFLFLAVIVGTWLARKNFAVKLAMGVMGLFFLGLFSYGQIQTARELSLGGQLYASYRWYDSKILALVRELPADVTIHTNQPEAVYLYTERPCALLPGSQPDIAKVQQNVLDGKAVIVLFISRGLDQETIDYYQVLGKGLNAIYEGTSVMYTAPR